MFCIKCGTQLPDESNFCSSCGANLGSSNTSVEKHGRCLFRIKRKNSFAGMAITIKVYIDGSLVKKLASGETFSKVLDNGNYNLHCEAVGMDRTQSFEFTGDDNEISYYVSFPSATQSMFNVGGRTLIVNKVLETEPGTYKE